MSLHILVVLALAVDAAAIAPTAVGRVGNTIITQASISCRPQLPCNGSDQDRFNAEVFRLVLDAVFAKARLRVNEADVRLQVERELPDDAIQSAAKAHRLVAQAALAVRRGEDVNSAHTRLLLPAGIPIDMLLDFLKLAADEAQVRSFLASDVADQIRTDYAAQVRAVFKRAAVVRFLNSLPRDERARFWDEVLKETKTFVVGHALVKPTVEEVLKHHVVNQ